MVNENESESTSFQKTNVIGTVLLKASPQRNEDIMRTVEVSGPMMYEIKNLTDEPSRCQE